MEGLKNNSDANLIIWKNCLALSCQENLHCFIHNFSKEVNNTNKGCFRKCLVNSKKRI